MQDALMLAGEVAAELEEYGVTACGRKEGGVTHLDFWSHSGRGYRCPVTGSEDVASLVRACLHVAGIEVPRPASTPPTWS